MAIKNCPVCKGEREVLRVYIGSDGNEHIDSDYTTCRTCRGTGADMQMVELVYDIIWNSYDWTCPICEQENFVEENNARDTAICRGCFGRFLAQYPDLED